MTTSLIRGLVIGSLLLFALPHRAEGKAHACTLLKAADLVPLFGKPVEGKPNGGACAWKPAGAKVQLVAGATKQSSKNPEAAFAGARQAMGKDPDVKVTDETGIGEKAFTAQTPVGVSLIALKGGRVLNLIYSKGTPGTAEEVAAMRLVGAKALAAF